MSNYIKLYKKCLEVAEDEHEREVITDVFARGLDCDNCIRSQGQCSISLKDCACALKEMA